MDDPRENDDYDAPFDPGDDGDSDPFGECGLFRDGGVYTCGDVGSEQCEFDCPFNVQIGRKRWFTPRKVEA